MTNQNDGFNQETAALGTLIAALAKAQSMFPVVSKDRTATIPLKSGGGYEYAYSDLASLIDAVRKPLSDNGLAYWQQVSRKDGEVQVKTVLGHSDGATISGELQMPIGDNRDPRSVASAITYGRRYSLSALLGVAAREEDDDAQAASVVPMARETNYVQAPVSKPVATKPVAVALPVVADDFVPAPDGFQYIAGYVYRNGWHNVTLINAEGMKENYSTKIDSIGGVAEKAFNDGLPVQVEGKPAKRPGEFYLNRVDVYRPDSLPKADVLDAFAVDGVPVNEDEIPF